MGWVYKEHRPAFVDKLQNLIEAQSMRLCVLFLDQENTFLLLLSLISPTKWYLKSKQSQYEYLRKIVHHYHQLAKDALNIW